MAATQGSFSKAAEKLFVSQSAVSQSIMQLEDAVGAKLFQRVPRGIELTKEGRMLFEHVEPAVNLIKSGEKRIGELISQRRENIIVSASDTHCMYYLPDILERFKSMNSEIGIVVANKTTSETMNLLKKGEVDIGVVNLPEKTMGNVKIWAKSGLDYCFIAKKGTTEASGALKSPEQIASMPLIMLEKGTGHRSHLEKYLAGSGQEVEPRMELGSIELLIKFAAMGMGVSCVERQFLEKSPYSKDTDIIPVKKPVGKRYIGVITLKGVPLSRPAEAFVKLVRGDQ